MLCGTALQTAILTYMVWRTDWKAEVIHRYLIINIVAYICVIYVIYIYTYILLYIHGLMPLDQACMRC